MPNVDKSVDFNPRSPHGERRQPFQKPPMHQRISIHAPRTGSDALDTKQLLTLGQFQSTLPARGATFVLYSLLPCCFISIHAPRTGSDLINLRNSPISRFQSTLPARGATLCAALSCVLAADFNPRSPHGERQNRPVRHRSFRHFNPRSPHGERHDSAGGNRRNHISIHAPRTGSDNEVLATGKMTIKISIHAPRTGSDIAALLTYAPSLDFNPRSPHGERRPEVVTA